MMKIKMKDMFGLSKKLRENYFQISNNKFKDLIKYLRGKYKINRKLFIALYYPSNFEIDILKIMLLSSFDMDKFHLFNFSFRLD